MNDTANGTPLKTNEGFYANVTLIDLQLAAVYYPLLVMIAKDKGTISYSDLVEQAQRAHPANPVVQRAIAVSTGRRLDVVRMFTRERELPDLTSLVVNKGSGECGIGFTRAFDPEVARERVFAYDWTQVATEFDGFVKTTETVIAPRKRITEAKAIQLMANYYAEHKATLPATVRQQRDLIIELLREGFAVEQAFEQAAQA